MRLPRFRFHQPGSAAEAKELLGELGPGARPLAGGTDLLVHLKKGLYPVDHVVDITGLEELDYLSSGDWLDIGPLTLSAQLAAWSAPGAEALAEAAAGLGTPIIRNRATIGGNLATARPAADFAAPLLALGGRLVLSGPQGDRTVPLPDFFTGPGQTIKADAELITAIQAPAAKEGAGAAFIKLGGPAGAGDRHYQPGRFYQAGSGRERSPKPERPWARSARPLAWLPSPAPDLDRGQTRRRRRLGL